jgi:hypothetical protein
MDAFATITLGSTSAPSTVSVDIPSDAEEQGTKGGGAFCTIA